MPAAPSTVLPAGRAGVCRAVMGWLAGADSAAGFGAGAGARAGSAAGGTGAAAGSGSSSGSAARAADSGSGSPGAAAGATSPAAASPAAAAPPASRLLLVTGPAGSGKTFTLAWAASELAVLAESADDERFAWVSARGLTPRVLAWQLAGQLGVTVTGPAALPTAIADRLRGSAGQSTGTGASGGGLGGSGFGPGVVDGVAADGLSNATANPDSLAHQSPNPDTEEPESPADPSANGARVPGSRSATWDLLSGPAALAYGVGRWSRVTILISELDLAGHLRDGSAREAVMSELLAPLLAVPGVRLIVESARTDVAGLADQPAPDAAASTETPAPALTSATIIDLGEARWTDRAEFAAWLDDLVPSGGAAAPQAYPNPTKAREILSLAANRHAGLLAASDERPWKLAAVPFDVAFREGIADQIVLEPANLVLVQQPALSTAIDALGSAVAPGTRAAWRVAGQALTNSTTIPERAAILHGAALAVGDHALAEAVAPYTRGTRPSDGAPVGDPIPWFTRWAGWRPLPPDTPRPTPWPGPVAALAMASGLAEAPVMAKVAAAEAEAAAEGGADSAAGGGVAEPAAAAEPAASEAATEPTIPPQLAVEVAKEPAAATAPPSAWLPATGPVPDEVLVAIDDLARAYRLDPGSGRIVGRPAAPVMVKARTAAVVDASPSLVLTDSGRRLAALGPGAPRGAVAAVRDVLPETVVTAVAVAGEALVFGADDGRVHVWHVGTEELIADPQDQHSGAVTAVAAIWMPDVDVLFALSGGQDGTFRLWAVPADASLLPVEDRGVPVTAVTAAITDVGPVAAVAWSDGFVTVWDLGEARTGRPIPLGWAPKALALGPDGLLIAAGEDGLIAIDVHLGDFFED